MKDCSCIPSLPPRTGAGRDQGLTEVNVIIVICNSYKTELEQAWMWNLEEPSTAQSSPPLLAGPSKSVQSLCS